MEVNIFRLLFNKLAPIADEIKVGELELVVFVDGPVVFARSESWFFSGELLVKIAHVLGGFLIRPIF